MGSEMSSQSSARRRKRARADAIHPIDFEVFKNLFLSIAEEMGGTLRRTGFSPNIKERLDYSCAVYDRRGETIAQGDHMPVHLGAMPLSVRAAIAASPMDPGDVVMLNDPYQGGTHLPDVTLVSPVFLDEPRRRGGRTRAPKPAFYVANRAHHSDVGGMSPGSMPVAREIYQEGLIVPPVRLVRRGRVVRDVLALLLSNVRTPQEREGDLTAQIAANRVAESRLRELVARYGRKPTLGYASALQDYTEHVMRAAIGAMPDGDYAFEDALDDDGFGSGEIGIRARVRVQGKTATVDFTGSDPQVEGSVNANYAITLSACLYAFRCLIEGDVLYNAGIARPLTVSAPEGTIVNAQRPAAVAGGNVETSQRITDVVLGALGKALPERLPAASQGTMNNVTLGGVDPATGRRFAYYETLGGGMGGRRGMAGLSGVHTHMSNTRNTPIEAIERYLPIRIRQYALRTGSGGAGAAPGGEGLVREYEALVEMSATVLSDRRVRRPYGALGGEPGSAGRNVLIRDGVEHVLPGKTEIRLRSGDRLRIETPGGGGYGRPTP
jgi:N-methylhydantoinase B/oxoprolinase/acetone carboxylase alpha subunit